MTAIRSRAVSTETIEFAVLEAGIGPLAQVPFADAVVGAERMALLDRLWQDWSPAYNPSADLEQVKECLRDPANLAAALGYYRAALAMPDRDSRRYAAEQDAVRQIAPQPTLYLHGDQDGCVSIELVDDVERYLGPGSRNAVMQGAGYFLHLEQPAAVGEQIVAWVTDG